MNKLIKMEMKHDNSWKIIRRSHMASYSLTNIIRLLLINKFRISLRYIPRLFWVLWMSFITLPLRIIEKIRFQKKINNTKLIKDPIFIIGFFRTATTLLHILFSKDKRLGYMSNLDIFTPLYNLSFSRIAKHVLIHRLPKTRPMDNIELDIEGPQEESYAVATISQYGTPNALIFPQNFSYFTKFITFKDCRETDLNKWKKVYQYFVKKTTLKNHGKQLVLKNPANAARIMHLLEMYPNAKFIYSYRNPYTLFCSMKLLFRKLMELSTLQTWNDEKFVLQFVKMFTQCFSEFERTKDLIPPENFYILKYEDFIENPISYLEEIYQKFGLEDFNEVKPIIQNYLDKIKNFKVNTHNITPQIIQLVNSEWELYRKRYSYDKLNPKEREKC